MLAAVATLGFGGAMGLEGPSLYLGASIGSFLQRRFRWMTGGASTRILLVAGAAAGVAAIFKAPATGAIFALEVPYQDDLARRMLLPALVSSASGYLVFVAINDTTPLLPVHGNAPFSFADLAGAIALGVAAGICARGFAWLVRRAKDLSVTGRGPTAHRRSRTHHRRDLRCHAGLTGKPITIGVGYSTVAVGAGGRPRHLVVGRDSRAPLLRDRNNGRRRRRRRIVHSTDRRRGAARTHRRRVVGDPKSTLFVVIGVAAFLGAGYRVPLAAVMFVAEASGRPGFVVPALLAAVAAPLVMGSSSVTAYQRASLAGTPPTDDGNLSRE